MGSSAREYPRTGCHNRALQAEAADLTLPRRLTMVQSTGKGGAMTAEALTPDEIDDLARRAREGDRDALEALLTAVRPRALNVCRGVLPHLPDAEDACQEALINIANKIGSW